MRFMAIRGGSVPPSPIPASGHDSSRSLLTATGSCRRCASCRSGYESALSRSAPASRSGSIPTPTSVIVASSAPREEVHSWSDERGDLLQIIEGIPYFYRQFGYEYALDEGQPRLLKRAHLPEAKGTWTFRQPRLDDVPAVLEMRTKASLAADVATVPTEQPVALASKGSTAAWAIHDLAP